MEALLTQNDGGVIIADETTIEKSIKYLSQNGELEDPEHTRKRQDK